MSFFDGGDWLLHNSCAYTCFIIGRQPTVGSKGKIRLYSIRSSLGRLFKQYVEMNGIFIKILLKLGFYLK